MQPKTPVKCSLTSFFCHPGEFQIYPKTCAAAYQNYWCAQPVSEQVSVLSICRALLRWAHHSFQANMWKTFAGHLLPHPLHRETFYPHLFEWWAALIYHPWDPALLLQTFIIPCQMGTSCLLSRWEHCMVGLNNLKDLFRTKRLYDSICLLLQVCGSIGIRRYIKNGALL